jgi:hypothetical protein
MNSTIEYFSSYKNSQEYEEIETFMNIINNELLEEEEEVQIKCLNKLLSIFEEEENQELVNQAGFETFKSFMKLFEKENFEISFQSQNILMIFAKKAPPREIFSIIMVCFYSGNSLQSFQILLELLEICIKN